MKKVNRIMISGARRSGTTFVGKVMSKQQESAYFFEPFNKDQGAKYLPNLWYPCLNENNIDEYLSRTLDEIYGEQRVSYKVSLYGENYVWWDLNRLDLIKNLFTNFSNEKILMRLARILFKNRSNFEYYKYKLSSNIKNIIYKDPLASLSTELLTNRYHIKNIIMLRHPYSYYYSMKKQGWGANPYENFFSQPEILEKHYRMVDHYLKKYGSSIEIFSLIEYLVVYSQLLKHRGDKNYLFVKHEDLAQEPILTFEKIFKFSHIPFSKKVKDYIYKNTNSSNKSDTKVVSNTKRDSKSLLKNWQGKLNDKELSIIKDITFETVKELYDIEEW